ncbi:MAG: hypothetical protein GEV03_13305 [Streptosporangiales bacterium]|nr:hypothetical protein [Streptosporangiales bacterium]
MPRGAQRLWPGLAAGWTLLYVGSKIWYAIEGRLGVTGGPIVPRSHYQDYGPGEVATAQWLNAGMGMLIVLLLLATLLPITSRAIHWALSVLLAAAALMASAGAVGMLGRALATDSGGALFGAYCVIWAVLITTALVVYWRRPRTPVRGPE